MEQHRSAAQPVLARHLLRSSEWELLWQVLSAQLSALPCGLISELQCLQQHVANMRQQAAGWVPARVRVAGKEAPAGD